MSVKSTSYIQTSRALLPALLISSIAGAWAQGEQSPAGTQKLEETLVTAERRVGNLQEAPMAISVLNAAEIESQQFTDFTEIGSRVPSVTLTTRLGVLQTAIRGVAAQDFTLGADPRVAFHKDGIYIPRGAAHAGAVYDLERIEIVQGPQGTLYGRNATAGAINIITKPPSEDFSGYARAAIGDYSLLKLNGALNVPVTDELAFRIATEIVERDGYGRNVYLSKDIDDYDSEAFRASLRWSLDAVQVDIIADYYDREDHSTAFFYTGYLETPTTQNPPVYINSQTILPSDSRDNSADYHSGFSNESGSLTARIAWDINDNLSFQSLTGYVNNDYHQFGDSDGTNVVATGGYSREESDAYSQEFQLSGKVGNTDFITGLYAFSEDIDAQSGFAASTIFPTIRGFLLAQGGPVPPPTDYVGINMTQAEQETEAYAVFATITQNFSDDLRLILGGRYTWESKEVLRGGQGLPHPGTPVAIIDDLGDDFNLSREYFRPREDENWDEFSPSVTLQYDFSGDMMGYLTYAEGFKSGAYGLADFNDPVKPETLKDLEGGIKADWLDGRLRSNFSAFYYDYEGLQVSVLSENILSPENAAEATAYGAQIELTALITERLKLGVDSIFMRAEFEEYLTSDIARPLLGELDLEGNDLPQSPDYKVSISANYHIPFADSELNFNARATFTDDFYTTVYNLETQTSDSSEVYDASVEYSMENGFSVSVWGNNLSDELIITQSFPSSVLVGNPTNVAYGSPRTYGMTLGYQW